MSTATNVTTGKAKVGGAIFCAPVGTALPTDATTALNAAFKDVGYASEDGVTNNGEITSDNVKAWGGDVVLSYQESREDTFSFKLIEAMNVEALKAVYGDENVTGDLASGITIKANNSQLEAHSWVIDMILRGGKLKRIVIPNGTVTAVAKVVYKDNEAVGYDTTITAAVDGSGNTHYEYIASPAA